LIMVKHSPVEFDWREWFVPPVVIPIFLIILIVAYALLKPT